MIRSTRRALSFLSGVAAACLLWLAPAPAFAQDEFAVVYIDPADNIQKVRVPVSQARLNSGLQWALTERGKPVAYNSGQVYPSDNPQAYQVFAFFAYNDAPRRPTIANPLDPYAFVYERATLDDESGDTAVRRIAMKWADYERWTEQQINDLIASGQAQPGANVQTGAFGGPQPGPAGQPGGSDPRAFAEWTHYYNQLNLWEEYITQEIFNVGFIELMSDFSIPRDPTRARDVMPILYEDLLRRRDTMMDQLDRGNLEFYQRMQRRREARERYEEWRIEQQRGLMEFADRWERRARGAEVVVEGTPFIVSTEPTDNPPKDGVFVVNESELLTPYDILTREGELKEVYPGQ
jgi:hypothetical protein